MTGLQTSCPYCHFPKRKQRFTGTGDSEVMEQGFKAGCPVSRGVPRAPHEGHLQELEVGVPCSRPQATGGPGIAAQFMETLSSFSGAGSPVLTPSLPPQTPCLHVSRGAHGHKGNVPACQRNTSAEVACIHVTVYCSQSISTIVISFDSQPSHMWLIVLFPFY